jgi:prepilin-type N-terminal cleavage/methylation domain-containing protein
MYIHRMTRNRQSRFRGDCRGFSLVEILTVIAIMVLISSVGFLSMNSGSGTKVSAAADQAAGLMQRARSEAITLGLGAKVVIDNGSDPKTQLRRMAIFTAVEGANPGDISGWALADKPMFLPAGVYLLPDYSEGFVMAQYDFQSVAPQDGSSGIDCMEIAFDGQGELADANVVRLVFSKAPAAGDTPPESMLAGRRGFLIRKTGRPVYFEDPSQMAAVGSGP